MEIIVRGVVADDALHANRICLKFAGACSQLHGEAVSADFDYAEPVPFGALGIGKIIWRSVQITIHVANGLVAVEQRKFSNVRIARQWGPECRKIVVGARYETSELP